MNSIDLASSEYKETLSLIIESGIYRHHALRKRIHKILEKTDTNSAWNMMKVPHWEVLYHLIEYQLRNKTVTISDIPLGTGMPATTTRRLVRFLEKKGIIETYRDDRDKRRIIVGLTREYRQEICDFIADYTDGFAGLIQRHDKQERKLAEAQLERTRGELLDGEERFRKLMQDVSAAVVVHAADTSISFINDKALELLGITNYEAMDRLALDPNWLFLYLDKTPIEVEDYPVNQVIASGEPMQKMELGIERTLTGDIKWVLVSAVPVFKNRNLKEIIVSFMDITERKQVEDELRQVSEQNKAILHALTDLVCTVDEDGQFIEILSNSDNGLHSKTKQKMGNTIHSVFPLNEAIKCLEIIQESIKTRKILNFDYSIPVHNGNNYFSARIIPVPLDQRGKNKVVLVARDITERRIAEAEIYNLAMTDELTALANRRRLHQNMQQNISLAKREGRFLALMSLDLDNFKPVNDTYGHPVGDAVLKNVASILNKFSRDTDTVARTGGDEFHFLVVHPKSNKGVRQSAQRVIDEINKIMHIEGHKIHISVSIGIALYPEDARTENELVRKSDLALYKVKKRRGGSYLFYNSE